MFLFSLVILSKLFSRCDRKRTQKRKRMLVKFDKRHLCCKKNTRDRVKIQVRCELYFLIEIIKISFYRFVVIQLEFFL